MRSITALAATVLASFLSFTFAQALPQGDADSGSQLAQEQCVRCHHPRGDSDEPEQARIAGQNAPYLTLQLYALRAGARPSETMNPIAAELSDQDIADLAAFWSAAEPAGSAWDGQDETATERGRSIFEDVDAAAGQIACAVCHGTQGQGVADLVIPRIAGQAPVYLRAILAEFAAVPDFGMPAPNAMHIVASALSDDDVDAIVAYLASQPWGSTP